MTDTRHAADELEGRDLDEAVAEEVLGWRYLEMESYGDVHRGWNPDRQSPPEPPEEVPHYSIEISEAWRIYKVGLDRGWWNGIISNHEFGECYVVLAGAEIEYIATAKTEALAICRAALKSVREEET